MVKKVNLFRKIKSMKINHIKINTILFKSLIISITDYAFIPLSCPTQKIMNKLQIIQTRILRQIKYFPLKTRTSAIHNYFNVKTVESRTNDLLLKFTKSKINHDLISQELQIFKNEIHPSKRKLWTIFDTMLDHYNNIRD